MASSISETMEKAGQLVRHAIGAVFSPIRAGDDKMVSRQADTSVPLLLRVWSDTFVNGQPIPVKCTPAGANVSPSLSWSNVPERTKELILICEDPDAPTVSPVLHWLLHDLGPDAVSLPEGVPNTRELPQLGGAVQGQNYSKTWGWSGPKPPLGHGVHHYHFQLFALDKVLNLGSETTLENIVDAMKGHVLAEGEVIGTHELKGTD